MPWKKKWGYNSTLSSTSTLDEDRISGQQHAPATLPPGMRVGTHRTGGGVAPGTGLDRRGEIAPPSTGIWTPNRPACSESYLYVGGVIKFCLHCNIFIYIRYIWIKPVLCCRMISLFHHISPWTHRCLQVSPTAHRNGRIFRRSVQTACCYWILNREKISSNWNSQTNSSRLWWSVSWCEYSKTVRRFKDGELGQVDLSDKTRRTDLKN